MLQSGGIPGHCPDPRCGTEEEEEAFLSLESGGPAPCQSLSVCNNIKRYRAQELTINMCEL